MFLFKKNQTITKLPELFKQIQNEQGLSIIKIRSDKGIKFLNTHMTEYCKEQGISHVTSTARTPQQNGVSERRNITLKEAARTMLAEYNVPQKFWKEAINTTCYTQNRNLLIKRHGKTPYEVWKDKTPSVSFFHDEGSTI